MASMEPATTLIKKGYHLVGSGAVKPCLWLNRALRGEDQCYKHHFYGISSHRCVQMTPIMECNHLCLHCWRPIDYQIRGQVPVEPNVLLDGIFREHRKILSGYGGSKTTDISRLDEAKMPKHIAISLMGEPTLYPYLDELLQEIKKENMTSFLVSNGTNPEFLSYLKPTQLYISLNAYCEEQYKYLCRPQKNFWPKILESLDLISHHYCRSVVRMTLVRGLNMNKPDAYARILKRAEVDFVEVKAYMHLGQSRARLGREAMPEHNEILEFSNALASELGYKLEAEVPLSRVVLLSSGRVERALQFK